MSPDCFLAYLLACHLDISSVFFSIITLEEMGSLSALYYSIMHCKFTIWLMFLHYKFQM